MNKMFVYRGILVRFDEKIGWFFYEDDKRLSFKKWDDFLDFINGIS
jgi:hypothetical protein